MLVGGPVYSLTKPMTRPWAVDGVMRGALVMSSPAWACAPVASVNLSKGAVEAPAMSQAMTMIPVLLATLKEMVRSLPGVALTAYQTCGLSRLSPASLVQALPLLSLTLVIASWPVFTGAVKASRFPDDGRFTVDVPGQGWKVCCMFWMRIPLEGAVPADATLKAMAMVLKWSVPDPWATVSVGLMGDAEGIEDRRRLVVGDEVEVRAHGPGVALVVADEDRTGRRVRVGQGENQGVVCQRGSCEVDDEIIPDFDVAVRIGGEVLYERRLRRRDGLRRRGAGGVGIRRVAG